ncbi:hypothetical protein AC626_15230 [Pseudoalteromonas rubra]|uniref:Uncharacterized protein n=1 Tax=Pseudoalteromonas rubra TaxID=43658 RepID=A0A0L0EQC3_9GAMM|nr:hypothetical protein AC626_15230 [Pseudoalteromonas rubra]
MQTVVCLWAYSMVKIARVHSIQTFSTLDTVVDNKAKNPVLYQILECENAVGKTMAVKVFNLTDPNGIYTYEDQLIVK